MSKFLKIKISIVDSNPLIWREIVIPDDISFKKLHSNIQLAMGWTGARRYIFQFDGITLSDKTMKFADEADDMTIDDKITEVLNKRGVVISYVYDMEDNWDHDIEVTGVTAKNKYDQCPVCIGGERKGPPEECGGVPGFKKILQVMQDKDHESYNDVNNLLGGNWDFEEFNIDVINKMYKDPDRYLFNDNPLENS